jgi:hypothetical protein
MTVLGRRNGHSAAVAKKFFQMHSPSESSPNHQAAGAPQKIEIVRIES